MDRMIGGGTVVDIEVNCHNRPEKVTARMGLNRSDIGVITGTDDPSLESELIGKLPVPIWEKAFQHGVSRREVTHWPSDWRKMQVVYSLPEAIRQTFHILKEEGVTLKEGDKARMLAAMQEGRKLLEALIGLRTTNAEEYQKRLSLLIRRIMERIGRQPSNEIKQEALALAVELKTLSDARGRVGESQKMRQALALIDRFTERMEGLAVIEPVIAWRQSVLRNIQRLIEYRLENALAVIRPVLYPDHLEGLGELGRKRLDLQLLFVQQDLAGIDLRPYRANCQRAALEIAVARLALKQKYFMRVRKLLRRVRESLYLKSIQRRLEDIIYEVTVSFYQVETLDEAAWRHLENETSHVYNALGRVDERDFVEPVCDEARKLIREALAFLKFRNLSELTEAKLHLKSVSHLL